MSNNHKPQSESPLADPPPIEVVQALSRPPADVATGINRPRKPFGTVESKLAWPEIPGFNLRWINDDPGRIERAKEAGYEHVRNADGSAVKQVVGSGARGGALDGYIMKIPLEFFDADFATKMKAVDMIDLALLRGRVKDAKAEDRLYVPRDGIGEPVIKMGSVRGRNPTA